MSKEKSSVPFYKKKWFLILVAVIVIAALASGNNDKDEPKKDDSTAVVENANEGSTTQEQPTVADTTEKPTPEPEPEPTPEPEPEPTPEPEPEPTPEPEVEEVKSWKDGTYKVGTDIQPGEYVIFTNFFMGYAEISTDSSGTLASIKANENIQGNVIFTVNEGEYLKLQDATAYLIGTEPELDTTKEGHFKVGTHIEPGEYKVILDESSTGMGYIEVSKDSSGTLLSIISNENLTGDSYITIADGQYIKLYDAHLE